MLWLATPSGVSGHAGVRWFLRVRSVPQGILDAAPVRLVNRGAAMTSDEITPTRGLDTAALVGRLAAAKSLPGLPDIVDITASAPPNPPENVQAQFAGRSYEDAYNEAATFVYVVDEWLTRHCDRPLSPKSRVLDFGSGWGRITRVLLTLVPPTSLFAVDVDPQMTALLNTTLPGVNALTVTPMPPTVLADASVDAAIAFSVFSHLAPHTHEAWADEFGRVLAPGGMAFITLMDAAFLTQVREAKEQVAAGAAVPFQVGLAPVFDDIDTAETAFNNGEAVYSPSGGGGIRTSDYYGWAAMPPRYIQQVWGAAGFDVVEWVPSGVLFGQAMVGLVRHQPSRRHRHRPRTRRFGK